VERVQPDPVQLMKLETLEDVLHAGYHVVDVIVQDEYCHDVIATRDDRWFVFDTT
jgi:hypothetical protein